MRLGVNTEDFNKTFTKESLPITQKHMRSNT